MVGLVFLLFLSYKPKYNQQPKIIYQSCRLRKLFLGGGGGGGFTYLFIFTIFEGEKEKKCLQHTGTNYSNCESCHMWKQKTNHFLRMDFPTKNVPIIIFE